MDVVKRMWNTVAHNKYLVLLRISTGRSPWQINFSIYYIVEANREVERIVYPRY